MFFCSFLLPVRNMKLDLKKRKHIVISDSLTIENVAKFIKESGIKEPEIIFKKSMLETGWLSSNLAKKHFNLFGMKKAGKWKQRHNKVIKWNYLSYNNWKNSILDYFEYSNKFGNFAKNYSSNPKYYQLVNGIEIPENINLIFENQRCRNERD